MGGPEDDPGSKLFFQYSGEANFSKITKLCTIFFINHWSETDFFFGKISGTNFSFFVNSSTATAY